MRSTYANWDRACFRILRLLVFYSSCVLGFLFLSMKGERPIRSFVIKSLALLEIMWSTLFWLWGHECLLVLCRTAYGLGCRLGLSRLHTWKQALWVVSSNQTQRVVESMETVQKSDSRLHSVDAKTLTWDLEAFHVTTMISM